MFTLPSVASGSALLFVLVLVVLAVALFQNTMKFRFPGPILVLRRFVVSDRPPDGVLVDLVGRKSGFIGWALTRLGWNPEVTLRVTRTEAYLKQHALSGEVYEVAPLQHVGVVRGGYARPIWLLFVAIALGLFGLTTLVAGPSAGSDWPRSSSRTSILYDLAAVIGFWAIAAVCLGVYWLRKRMFLTVESGKTTISCGFKRSLIENVTADFDKVLRAVDIANRAVVEAHVAPTYAAAVDQRQPITGRVAAGGLSTDSPTFCTACGARMPAGQRFCPACSADQE